MTGGEREEEKVGQNLREEDLCVGSWLINLFLNCSLSASLPSVSWNHTPSLPLSLPPPVFISHLSDSETCRWNRTRPRNLFRCFCRRSFPLPPWWHPFVSCLCVFKMNPFAFSESLLFGVSLHRKEMQFGDKIAKRWNEDWCRDDSVGSTVFSQHQMWLMISSACHLPLSNCCRKNELLYRRAAYHSLPLFLKLFYF